MGVWVGVMGAEIRDGDGVVVGWGTGVGSQEAGKVWVPWGRAPQSQLSGESASG